MMWLVVALALLHRMPNHTQVELAGDQEDKLLVLLLSKVDFQWRRAAAACSLWAAWDVHTRRKKRMQRRFLGRSIVVALAVHGSRNRQMQFIVARVKHQVFLPLDFFPSLQL